MWSLPAFYKGCRIHCPAALCALTLGHLPRLLMVITALGGKDLPS